MAGVPLLTRQAAKGAVSNQKENLIMSKQQPGRKPTHGVYHIRGEGKNAYWTKIGAACIHEDGEGLKPEPGVHPHRHHGTPRHPRQQGRHANPGGGRPRLRLPRRSVPGVQAPGTERPGTGGPARCLAHDHLDDNPAYGWNDDEEAAQ
jgi:hypothetical protein